MEDIHDTTSERSPSCIGKKVKKLLKRKAEGTPTKEDQAKQAKVILPRRRSQAPPDIGAIIQVVNAMKALEKGPEQQQENKRENKTEGVATHAVPQVSGELQLDKADQSEEGSIISSVRGTLYDEKGVPCIKSFAEARFILEFATRLANHEPAKLRILAIQDQVMVIQELEKRASAVVTSGSPVSFGDSLGEFLTPYLAEYLAAKWVSDSVTHRISIGVAYAILTFPLAELRNWKLSDIKKHVEEVGLTQSPASRALGPRAKAGEDYRGIRLASQGQNLTPFPQQGQKVSVSAAPRVCYNCQSQSHIGRDCPNECKWCPKHGFLRQPKHAAKDCKNRK